MIAYRFVVLGMFRDLITNRINELVHDEMATRNARKDLVSAIVERKFLKKIGCVREFNLFPISKHILPRCPAKAIGSVSTSCSHFATRSCNRNPADETV